MSVAPSRAPKVVVIGAGMGGLAAAIELAARGQTVTVIERQDQPGGKMREIFVDGHGIDSGPTVFTMRRVFDELFSTAGERFANRVALRQSDVLARHSWLDGSQLDLFADVERTAQAIERFGGQPSARAYRSFARRAEDMFNTLDETFMRVEKPSPVALTFSKGLAGIPALLRTRPFASLWSELGKIFADPKLQQLFGRYATYCGSSPLQSPATLMLIAHAERAGVWFVNGGMQRLAEVMADVAAEQGAVFRYGHTVTRIETRHCAVTAVHLADGTVVDADAVIFNGEYAALANGMMGQKVAVGLTQRQGEKRSLSALTWTTRAEPQGFDLSHHNVFFGGNYKHEFESLFDSATVADQPTVYVCAQDRGDPHAAPPRGCERLFFLINAPARAMTDDEVRRLEDRTFNHLQQHGLTIEGGVPLTATTPNDYALRFPGSDGAIYGWPTHGWSGSFRRSGSRTPTTGLYLAGGTVHPGPGVPMAATSGRIAAASLCRDFRI